MTDRPMGQRFSLTYLPLGDPTKDSETMRYRLGKLIGKDKYQPRRRQGSYVGRTTNYVANPSSLHTLVEEEIGVHFRTVSNGQVYTSWVSFLRKLPPHKVLDTITVVYRGMSEVGRQDDFIQQVNRIFREENVAYEVDDQGGVHPVVDRAFSAAKQSAILGMSDPRYALSLVRLEEMDLALIASPPNYINAIRSIFGANENLFKLMFGTPRLDQKSASERLGPRLQACYEGHPTMQRSSAQVLKSFGCWIDSAHHYRHEEGAEQPSQPREEHAILIISQGISYVRWLVAIDTLSGKGG